VRFQHQFERFPQALPAFAKRSALRDGPGNFFDPAHEPPVFWPDDGVVSLSHERIVERRLESSQGKSGMGVPPG
jgi:hypothetical protein